MENQAGPDALGSATDLPTALLACAERHRGQLLTILSGTDLTAAETESLMAKHPRWQSALTRPSTALLRIAEADHTFSNPAHWDEAIDWLANRINSL